MLMIDELKQTRVYKDALEEGRRSVILKLLTQKLGRLADSAIERVQRLDASQLDALSDRLLEISTTEELERYLTDIQS